LKLQKKIYSKRKISNILQEGKIIIKNKKNT